MGKLQINTTTALDAGENYYVLVDEGFTVDANTGTLSPAITDPAAIAFASNPLLVLIGSTPADQDFALQFNSTTDSWRLDLVFNADIIEGTGNVVVTNLTNDTRTFISEWDASVGTFPADSAQYEWFVVSVAGTVDGQSFTIGDVLQGLVNPPSTTIFAGEWLKINSLQTIDVGDLVYIVSPIDAPNTTGATVSVYIDNSDKLDFDTDYFVYAPAGAFQTADACLENPGLVSTESQICSQATDTNTVGFEPAFVISGLDMTFCNEESVLVGVGNVSIFTTAGDVLTATIDVTTGTIVARDFTDQTIVNTLRLTTPVRLVEGTSYYATAPAGIVIDSNGFQHPAVVQSDPDVIFDFTDQAHSGSLSLDFPRNIRQADGDTPGSVFLYRYDDDVEIHEWNLLYDDSSWLSDVTNEFYDPDDIIYADDIVAFNKNRLTMPATLIQGEHYYIIIDSGAITDLEGIPMDGILVKGDLDFTMFDGPRLLSATFTDSLTPPLRLFFTDTIFYHTDGDIRIQRDSDSAVIRTIDVPGTTVLAGSELRAELDIFDAAFTYNVLTDTDIVRDSNDYNHTGNFGNLVQIVPSTDIVSSIPSDGATSVVDLLVNAIELQFNSDVTANTGNIYIRKVSDDSVGQSWDVTADITIVDDTVSFLLTNPLTTGTDYYISIDEGALSNDNPTTWDGTNLLQVISFETNAMTVLSRTPADDATGVNDLNTTGFEIQFDDTITANVGNVYIKRTSDDVIIDTFDVTTDITIIVDTASAVSSALFEGLTEYYVNSDADIVLDSNGFGWEGISDKTTWNWTMAAAPAISSQVPVDDSSGQYSGTTFSITYDSNVTINTGDIRVYEMIGDVLIETVDVTTGSVLGATLSFNNITLLNDVDYYILIDSGIVYETATNILSDAITSTMEWVFHNFIVEVQIFTPQDDAVDVTGNNLLQMTFNSDVQALTGNIKLYETIGDFLVETFDVTSDVVFAGADVTFDATDLLTESTDYYILADDDCLEAVATGSNWTGIQDKTTWNFTTDVATIAILSTVPDDNDINVDIDATITITFNKDIDVGTGNFYLYETVGDTLVETFDVTSDVAVNSDNVVITPAIDMIQNTEHYVLADEGVVSSADLEFEWQGISDSTELSFITDAVYILSSDPADDETDVWANQNITITFDRNITAQTGNFYLYKTVGDTLIETFDVTTDVTVNVDNVVLNPAANLDTFEEYYVLADVDVVSNVGNTLEFIGISSTTELSFTAGALDITALFPVDDTADVVPNITAVITYDESITVQTGDIRIYETDGDALVATIDVTTLTPDGTTLPFDLPSEVDAGVAYYILIDADIVIGNTTDNLPVAITDKTDWNFITGVLPVDSFDPVDNAVDVAPDATFTITYDENITIQAGNIYAYETAGDALIDTIDVTTLTESGADLPFAFTGLLSDIGYYILADADIVSGNTSGQFSVAITDKTAWNFTTDSLAVVALAPLDDSIEADVTLTATISYAENISVATGDIRIYETVGDALIETVDVTTLTPSGADLPIPFVTTLDAGTGYYILIDQHIVTGDTSSLQPGPITDKTDWNFTTETLVAIATVPVDNATDVFKFATASIQFNHDISVNVGLISIYETVGDALVGTVNVATDPSIAVSTDTLSFDFPGALDFEEQYYVLYPAGIVVNSVSSVEADALTDSTAWNFTTGIDGVAATIVPVDFVTSCSIFHDASIQIDAGSGYVSYSGSGTAVFTPSDDILLRAINASLTTIRLTTDTFDELDITNLSTLTSFFEMCDGNTALTSFTTTSTAPITTLKNAWRDCSGLTSFPVISLVGIDTAFGTEAVQSTWQGCTGLTSFPLIDTSSLLYIQSTWQDCTGLTSFPLIDTSAAVRFVNTWKGCTGLSAFPLIDTTAVDSAATNGGTLLGTWQDCTGLTSFPSIDTSGVKIAQGTWQDCTGLTSFPALDFTHDAPSGSNTLSFTWQGCTGLTLFPLIALPTGSAGTVFSSTWEGCTGLTEFPLLDTAKVFSFSEAWKGCTGLTTMPLLDLTANSGNNTSFRQTWMDCAGLEFMPAFDTVQGKDFEQMFENCTSLVCLAALDTTNETTTTDLFNNTPSLLHPTPAEQTSLLAGFDYTNPSPCPLTLEALIIPVDFVASCSIFHDDDIQIDSGSGFTLYAGSGTAVFTPSTNITLTSVIGSSLPTQIQFTTDTFDEIDITDASPLTSFNGLCTGLTALTVFDATNTENVTDFDNAFEGCTGLTSFPLIDTSGALTMNQTWKGCSGFTAFPLIDVTTVTDFFETWRACTGLLSMPAIDTILGEDFGATFRGCTSLICLSALDTRNETNTSQLFNNTASLTDPDNTERSALLTGSLYTNASACP